MQATQSGQLTEFISTGIALLDQFAPALAIGMGVYWLWTLWRRTRNSSDPSLRRFSSSGIGSASFLVSGAYVSMLIAAGIAALTWPLVVDTPAVGVSLAVGVAFHAALEKREDMEAAS